MARGAEGDPLRGVRDIGFMGVICRDQPRDIDEDGSRGRLSGKLVDAHLFSSTMGLP